MKEKILSALKTKYANLGLSDQVLNSASEFLANSVTEENQIEGAIIGVENLLKCFQSETDKIRTSQNQNLKKTLKKENQPSQENKGAENNSEPESVSQMPEWAKGLVTAVSTLSADLKALKGEKITNQRKGIFDEIIKDLPPSLKTAYQRTNFTDMSDDDFNALTSNVKKEVENITKEIGIKGGIFKMPYSGAKQNPNEKTDKEIEKVVDKIKI